MQAQTITLWTKPLVPVPGVERSKLYRRSQSAELKV